MMNNTRASLRQNFAMILMVLAIFCLAMASSVWDGLSANRWFRDITWQTPFHGVTAEVQRTDGGVLVRGTMVKRRCHYMHLRAYARLETGLRLPTAVDDSLEADVWGGGSRPPSKLPEAWGPWLIADPAFGTPERWELFAFHTCPNGRVQVNLLAHGPWPQVD